METKLRTELLAHLTTWAAELQKKIGTEGVFLFGSLVYRDGEQFNDANSDIDLIALFPSNSVEHAVQRIHWLEKLRDLKAALEGNLGRILPRKDIVLQL